MSKCICIKSLGNINGGIFECGDKHLYEDTTDVFRKVYFGSKPDDYLLFALFRGNYYFYDYFITIKEYRLKRINQLIENE